MPYNNIIMSEVTKLMMSDFEKKIIAVKELCQRGAIDSQFTPPELCQEILDKIDVTNKTILTFNIEFVLTLVFKYNVDRSNITIYTVNEQVKNICKRSGVKCIDAMEPNMKFDVVVGNPPYNDGRAGRHPIWYRFVLSNVGNTATSWVIPTSWMMSETSIYNDVRNFILASGLKTIKINSKDTFESATVRTVTVFMEKGYDGEVEVQGDTNYFYNFKKNKLVVDTGSAEGNDVLFSLKEKSSLLGHTTKNKKDEVIAAETTNTNDVKFLKKMAKAGNEYGYAPLNVFSPNDHDDEWRVVVGYRPSGLEMGDYRLGLTSIVEPGVRILQTPLIYIPVKSKEHGENLQRYFKTRIVEEFILKNTRTSPTLDIKQSTGQAKFLPMLPEDIDIHTEDDVYKFFNLTAADVALVEEQVL